MNVKIRELGVPLSPVTAHCWTFVGHIEGKLGLASIEICEKELAPSLYRL